MKQMLRRLVILSVIFIIAGGGYFFWMRDRMSGGDTIYISMEESLLPVVYMDMAGREMNCLHGYVQEMERAGVDTSLTILPEDRNLAIRISRCQGEVTGIYYEIRSLDLSRLVERASLGQWDLTEDGAKATLPIQNLLARDQEYLMVLTVDTDSQGAVRYYTRIVWTDHEAVKGMVDLAVDFSSRTFSYEAARELVTYLESDTTGDNSNLGHVGIHSSYSQITWGELEVEPAGEVLVTLKELNGMSAQVTLEYLAVTKEEDGGISYYEVEDNFTMRQGEQRVYMMDFDRRVDQVFRRSEENFTGTRIMLGITDDDQVWAVKSENRNFCAFVSNHDLWEYDEQEKNAVRIFSFRSSREEGQYPAYREHAIKILRTEDSGDVQFLVYGYMNRGHHEGCIGVALYQYSSQEDALEERFFVPVTESYERLKLDLDELSYLSASDVLYLKIGQGVFGIDLTSNEHVVVAEGLQEGGYAISQNGRRLAWQEGDSIYQSNRIYLMNLETGQKDEVVADGHDCLRVLGFVGNDFIYGIAAEGSSWTVNGRLVELPMYALEILGEEMELQTRYEKPGYFISGVTVGDSRIQLTRIVPLSGDSYQPVDEDTIVCNEEIPDNKMENIGWYADSQRQRLYFIQLSSEIQTDREIHFSAPEKIAYETSEILRLDSLAVAQGMRFFAYGGGHLLTVTQDFAQAVAAAYERMGTVADENRQVLWNRIDRPSSITVDNQADEGGILIRNVGSFIDSRILPNGTVLLDARGCSLSQVLYFLGRGCPVLAYGEGGVEYLLVGYDSYNVTVYQPETEESWKIGLNDANTYFSLTGNDFICGVFAE